MRPLKVAIRDLQIVIARAKYCDLLLTQNFVHHAGTVLPSACSNGTTHISGGQYAGKHDFGQVSVYKHTRNLIENARNSSKK